MAKANGKIWLGDANFKVGLQKYVITASLYRSHFVLSYRKSTSNYIYQCGKQVVENEVYGHHWSPHLSHCHQSLVHDIHPSLLCKNLEHGHKCLQERKREIISLFFYQSVFSLSACISLFFYEKTTKVLYKLDSPQCLIWIFWKSYAVGITQGGKNYFWLN